tara:strand:+ start:370 stop:1194 length:825 start_codon:yes stop_codon:yes gene_type:complete
MAQQTNSFGFLQGSGSGGGGTNTNLGNSDLTLDGGTAERQYSLEDNDLVFNNGSGSDCIKISAQESELTLGGDGCQSVFFKSATSAPDIRIFEASGSGTNYVKLTLGALASNRTITIPDATGTISLLESAQTFTGQQTINLRRFDVSSSTDGDTIGDVVYFGSASVTAGKIYYWTGSDWANTDASTTTTASGMLAVATGTGTASSVGMCIRGMVTLDHDAGNNGNILFLSETANQATSVTPTTSGAIVRIIGYCLDDTNGQIYFNPDNTFILNA